MDSRHVAIRTFTNLLIIGLAVTCIIFAADQQPKLRTLTKSSLSWLQGPIVEDDWTWHKIGTLWNRVTNYGKLGDDAYQNRTPSCDWPGGSGNSYIYRGSIWLTAKVDGVPHTTKPEEQEYAPIDSVHVITGEEARSDEDTYTRYYDVKAPLSSGHFPLGVEVTERTFAWSASFAGDFIIYEFTLKNVGIDTDDDGYPDTPRELQDFCFTFRMDADVSKLPTWATESDFECWDDHAMANAGSWDWLELFPNMAGRDHGLTEADLDSTMVFMWDGDNPNVPAENGQPNDFGNPGPDGTLQSPGFIGFKILKTEPYLKPGSFHVCHIYNDPPNDAETWNTMIGKEEFEDIQLDPNGAPYPYDYRGILTFGPLDIFNPGDSVVITAALGVGCDPDSGGVYSLKQLFKIMNVAQFIVDNDYNISAEALAPPAPTVEVEEYLEDGHVQGVVVTWDDAPTQHQNFQGFKVWKSSGKTLAGAYDWQPLGLGTYIDTAGSPSWPPPEADEAGKYQIIDTTDIINGMDYCYSVQSFSIEIMEPIPFGVVESSMLGKNSFRRISPANPVATTLDNVKVVPNPYIGSVMWNNPLPSEAYAWEHRIQFTNLPADATVKIFTLDGGFVAETQSSYAVRVEGTVAATGRESVAEWDLITRNNQEAAPGIYLYVVESPSLGETIGKFVIIR